MTVYDCSAARLIISFLYSIARPFGAIFSGFNCADPPAFNDHFLSVVVLEESLCPRGSSRTDFQVLVLENFRGLSRLSVSALCAGVSAGVAMT